MYAGEYQPGEDVQSNEEIADWLRENVRSDWHVVGTAAMRKPTDLLCFQHNEPDFPGLVIQFPGNLAV